MILYVNILNLNSSKLAGVGYFTQRINKVWSDTNYNFEAFDRVVFLSCGNSDVEKELQLPHSPKVEIRRLHFAKYFLFRIILEQLYLPLLLLYAKGVFFSVTPSIPLLLKLINRKIVLISTIHDLIPFVFPKKYSRLRAIYVKALTWYSAKFSDRIVTVSENTKKDLVRLVGVDPCVIHVVYNFVYPPPHKISNKDERFFLSICTIEPGKGIEEMMEGFNDFLIRGAYGTDFKYYIVGGQGWEFEQIYRCHGRLVHKDKIVFTGYVSEDEKREMLDSCTGIFLLSRYEGFGIPILEGLVYNKPSVVSRGSSLEEVCGRSGILAEAGSSENFSVSIDQLLSRRSLLIDEIPRQRRKFDPHEQVRILNDVLRGAK